MRAVALLGQAELRKHRSSMVLFVVLVALVTGAVLTAAAGARRTSTVLDRFLARQGDFDLVVAVSRPRVASDAATVSALASKLSTLDGVDDVVAAQRVFPWIDGGEDFGILTGPDARYLEMAGSALVDGRMPTADATGEVAVNDVAADEFGLGVGSVLEFPTLSLGLAEDMWDGAYSDEASSDAANIPDGPVLRFDVVGVYRETSSLEVDGLPGAILSPDAQGYLANSAASDAYFYLTGDPDEIDLEGALQTLSEAAPDGWVYHVDPSDTVAPIRSTFDAIALGLLLFALVAAVAGLIALAQVGTRNVAQAGATASVVKALGMRDRSIALAMAAPSTCATVLGTVLGAIGAVALSPLFPFSVARRAEVDPGVRVDWPVLVVGSACSIVLLSTWVLTSAWRQVRPEAPRAARSPSSPSTIGVGLRRQLPVAAGIGCSTVLAPPHVARGTKPGSAIVGAVLGVSGVIAIVVFTASQQGTVDHPERFGWAWDAMPYSLTEDAATVAGDLADDDRLDGVAVTYCSTAFVADVPEFACAIEPLSGSLALTQLRGNPPASPDEVAVGERTLAVHGLDIGDTIEVTGESGVTTPLRIVGTVVAPDPVAPGRAVVFTLPGLMRLHGVGDDGPLPFDESIPLEYPPGSDPAALQAALEADYPLNFGTGDAYAIVPQSLSQLERLRPTLYALAVFLGLIGAIGLVHFMLLSAGRRRHDTAVLKALGFVPRQIRTIATSQAVTIAAVGIAVGLPLGVLVGRSVWIATVDRIGIADTPTMPWLVGALVAVVAVVGAAIVSLVPGWRASRSTPADVLRAG